MLLSTCNMSLSSASNFLPSLHCLSSHRSLRLTSRRICLSCWDSCTKTFLSWLQNFCCSRVCRLMLWSWKSRCTSTFLCSSCSWKLAAGKVKRKKKKMSENQLIPLKVAELKRLCTWRWTLGSVFYIWCRAHCLVLPLYFSYWYLFCSKPRSSQISEFTITVFLQLKLRAVNPSSNIHCVFLVG